VLALADRAFALERGAVFHKGPAAPLLTDLEYRKKSCGCEISGPECSLQNKLLEIVIASEAEQSTGVPVRHRKGKALLESAEIIDKTNYRAWLVSGDKSKSQLNVLRAEIAETAAPRDAGPGDIRLV
jgi:hypothetical protein